MTKLNFCFTASYASLLMILSAVSVQASEFSPTDAANNFLVAVANGNVSVLSESPHDGPFFGNPSPLIHSGESPRDALERLRSQGLDSNHFFAEDASQVYYSFQGNGFGDYSSPVISRRTGKRVGTIGISCRGDFMNSSPWDICQVSGIYINN